MNCNQISDRLLDLASGTNADPETGQHLQTCNACAEKLAALVQTMSLLDEWQAPEPSPYFDTRMQALLREEKAKAASSSWLAWFRKPVLAWSLAGLLTIGATLVGLNSLHGPKVEIVNAPPGTAVGDLTSVDKDHELLANFDLLDVDDSDNGSVAVNP